MNVQALLATRLCEAAECPNDAEHASRLCNRCAYLKRAPVTITQPVHVDGLRCCKCGETKPDAAFHRNRKLDAGPRRGRHHECAQCHRDRLARRRACAST